MNYQNRAERQNGNESCRKNRHSKRKPDIYGFLPVHKTGGTFFCCKNEFFVGTVGFSERFYDFDSVYVFNCGVVQGLCALYGALKFGLVIDCHKRIKQEAERNRSKGRKSEFPVDVENQNKDCKGAKKVCRKLRRNMRKGCFHLVDSLADCVLNASAGFVKDIAERHSRDFIKAEEASAGKHIESCNVGT